MLYRTLEFFFADKSDKIRKREIDPVTVEIKYYLRCGLKNLITVEPES